MTVKDILFGVSKSVGILPQARWIDEIKAGGAYAADVGSSIVIADDGSIVPAGWTGVASGSSMSALAYVIQLPITGTSINGSFIINAAGNYYLYKIVKTSGGYIIVGKSDTIGYLAKLDTSLNLVFQNDVSSLYIKNCAVDSSGNIYITGLSDTANNIFICKLSSTGAVTWSTGFTTTTYDFGTAIATDSFANVYVAGTIASATAGCLLAKYNTAGTLQWKLTLSPTNTVINNIVVGTSGSIYLVGSIGTSTLIMAINSSGTILWQRTVVAGAGRDLALDSSENIYIVTGTGYVLKYSTGGVLQWSRRLDHTNSMELNGVTCDTNGNIYVAGFNLYQYKNMVIAKLAMTGADLSSVSPFSYVDAALTDSAGNVTSVTSTLVAYTPTISSTAASYSTSSQSNTLTRTSTGTV